jgi:NAD(P)H-dependent flavin oxidoreductase YrpB (nitropropane dioxygenase family)
MGTRFVASYVCDAHPHYKARLLEAGGRDTVLTGLFDLGWAAPHRVLRNSTYERWEAAGTLLHSSRRSSLDLRIEWEQMFVPGGIAQFRLARPHSAAQHFITHPRGQLPHPHANEDPRAGQYRGDHWSAAPSAAMTVRGLLELLRGVADQALNQRGGRRRSYA